MATKLENTTRPPKLPPPSQRTLAQSWMAIPARTRLFISLGLCIVGGTGLMISDFIETSIPKAPAQSEDH
ncbi:hypothetical protein BYT27DRAFT_7099437 [Phlegmacium glaucopus]|nr:hypothetical protein BYT27DRAFT_7099437 [Phlegmacium glaucopus]